MATVCVVFLVVWMGYYFVAGLLVFASEELLQCNDAGDKEGNLGEKDSLGSGESDDAQEERNESQDLQLSDGEKGDQLLQLLLFATSCNINERGLVKCQSLCIY